MKGMYRLFKTLCISIGLGLLVSLLALLFNVSIEYGAKTVNGAMSNVSAARVIIPLVGGIMMCLIYAFSLKTDATGIGVVQVLVELELVKTHLMKPSRVIIRILGAMMTLIFGFSAGRFGPIVHLGAAVGSNIAYRLKLKEQEIRLLIGCGASAAIAAVFQTPLFAAAFVLEVLYRKRYDHHFTPVLISALTAYAVGISFYPRATWQLGPKTAMEAYGAYLMLGLVSGILSILYILWINSATSFFKRRGNTYLNILLIALVIGVSGYVFPLNFEIHSNTTARIISGEFGLQVLLIIGVMKLLLTGLTLGSGYIGGNFYPAVTIGAAFGYLVGLTTHSSTPGSFGILGVGAMVAGYLSAPISGIVLTLELSKSFDFLIPAIMACSVSVLMVNHLLGEDVFTKPYKSIMANTSIRKL